MRRRGDTCEAPASRPTHLRANPPKPGSPRWPARPSGTKPLPPGRELPTATQPPTATRPARAACATAPQLPVRGYFWPMSAMPWVLTSAGLSSKDPAGLNFPYEARLPPLPSTWRPSFVPNNLAYDAMLGA